MAGAVVLVLAGCSAPTDVDDATSDAFRSRVVAVAERSAATDYAGAAAELDRLEQSLADAAGAGNVSPEREAAIRDAIALVRADLDALIAAATQPEPAPAPEPGPAPAPDDGNGNSGNDGGNGNSGNGNGKGNGGKKGNGGRGNDD